ncbi:uncharacterized protein TM35_001271040 [Trypanosoma theileri]|uniref:Mucin-associated surface protein (MASP) n=1 Tax=Trypanosoma theileri TaxID=67003 RepID=A0A1X0NFF6_9TRYP|nr:uncharacterized protein TM35_001271040 [Trypanosoma theileri]ORC81198.1 hypothetical protein TM35_001271040 [Trypanosoma theileri]
MTMTVMVRCYLLCSLTLALCCACGLVWADGPKASNALIKPSTVGVPSLVRHAIPADGGSWVSFEEDGGDAHDSETSTCVDNSDSHGCRKSIATHGSGDDEDLKQKKDESKEELKKGQEMERTNSDLERTQADPHANQHKGANNSNPLSLHEGRGSEVSLDSEELSAGQPQLPRKTNPDDPLHGAIGGKTKEQVEHIGAPDGGSSGSSSSRSSSHPSPTPSQPEPAVSTTYQARDKNTVDSKRIKNGEHVASHNIGAGDENEQQRQETSVRENQSQSTRQESARESLLQVPVSTPETQKALNKQESQSQTESHDTQNPQTTQANVQGTNNGHDSSAPTTESTGDVSPSNTTTDVTHNNQAENGTNVAKPAESESSTTTTTTTTTTTLPPELTNNKKSDADSSSSISSSVWVRVPLLIVVTLSCILVC